MFTKRHYKSAPTGAEVEENLAVGAAVVGAAVVTGAWVVVPPGLPHLGNVKPPQMPTMMKKMLSKNEKAFT